MKKISTIIVPILAVAAIVLSLAGTGVAVKLADRLESFGTVNYQTDPQFYVASSTVFTLTTTSQRILATSTPTRRVAVQVAPKNCTTANMAVFLNANRDVAATQSTGPIAYASSTLALGAYPNLPVPIGAVQAITAAGTCDVLVTEWRLQY